MIVGGPGSGKPRLQWQMWQWYKKYRMPPGAQDFYQFRIHDQAILSRETASSIDAAWLYQTLPRLDLLVLSPTEIHVVELKPKVRMAEIGQIEQYIQNLKRDPALAKYLNAPIKKVLCVIEDNANARAVATAQGIEYIIIPILELPEAP